MDGPALTGLATNIGLLRLIKTRMIVNNMACTLFSLEAGLQKSNFISAAVGDILPVIEATEIIIGMAALSVVLVGALELLCRKWERMPPSSDETSMRNQPH